jgi:peptide-methionine (S)-S-oxide reductase
VGYTGGSQPDPTYEALGDHTEAFQVDFDPRRTSYTDLLKIFWEDHDPSERPYSRQYMSAVFYENTTQWTQALETGRQRVAGKTVVIRTPMLPLAKFYRAEDYHQKYYLRRHKDLMREFGTYSPRAFTDSTVAARLNAYVSGHLMVEALEPEFERFGLSAGAKLRLRERLAEMAARRRG